MRGNQRGTSAGTELEGYASSVNAPFGAVLMATGDGNCFWAVMPGLISVIDEGGPSDAFSLVIDEGGPSDSWTLLIDEGAL